MASFNTAADSHFHGISGEVRSYVLSAIEGNLPNVKFCVGENALSPFVIATVTLPSVMGEVPCDLRGPVVGDDPIDNDSVYFANRPGVSYRTWDSRITTLPPLMQNKVTVIASEQGVITMFGGPLSEQEVNDPSTDRTDERAKFWATHALSDQSLTREEVKS
jgi:hypothetical protein